MKCADSKMLKWFQTEITLRESERRYKRERETILPVEEKNDHKKEEGTEKEEENRERGEERGEDRGEGVVLRKPKSPYTSGRSDSLLKFKVFFFFLLFVLLFCFILFCCLFVWLFVF